MENIAYRLMTTASEIRKIAFLGDYLPRKCGIATFTSDLCSAVTERLSDKSSIFTIALNDEGMVYDYPKEVIFSINQFHHSILLM